MTRRRIIIGVIVLLVPLIGFTQCVWAPPVYWGEAIHGRVVDADTGEPLKDAVVMADWKLYGGGAGHGGYHRSLLVQETQTDDKGAFVIAEWGPKRRPLYSILNNAPWLVVFKTGYQHTLLLNSEMTNEAVRRSEWDGHTIMLKRFAGTPKERLDKLDLVFSASRLQPMMLREILKDESLYPQWPEGSRLFFNHVRSFLDDPQKRMRFQ